MSNSKLKEACRTLSIDFRSVADKLDKVYANVRDVRMAASAVSAAAAGGVVVLGITSVLTSGATLPAFLAELCAVFGYVTAGGGVVSSGAKIIGDVINDIEMREMQAKWTAFQRDFDKFAYDSIQAPTLVESVVNAVVDVICIVTMIIGQSQVCDSLRSLVKTMKQEGTGQEALTSERVRKALKLPIVRVDATAFAVNVKYLVAASAEKGAKTKSPAGEQLRRLADKLDALYKTL